LSIPYRNEVRFYAQLASTVAMRVPQCYFAEIDGEEFNFTLLLEDLSPAAPGSSPRTKTDRSAGCRRPPFIGRRRWTFR
jgi:hypothetical protein